MLSPAHIGDNEVIPSSFFLLLFQQLRMCRSIQFDIVLLSKTPHAHKGHLYIPSRSSCHTLDTVACFAFARAGSVGEKIYVFNLSRRQRRNSVSSSALL